ncbi:hypothetical protein IEQ34_019087 [Dendrobium chrysotoxum]|uniref:WRKY domain-containing protein n=1 Tax=Dendrobium chrysotoxum TaxID=161865 RepID=A0AAV7G901_DENCH|nr:hypothetical protein IEQ34_019087 [Dendrobium chrysotoxum]
MVLCMRRSSSAQKNNHRLKSTRVSFKTKSDHDVLDDGYKWRKYGKKMVKSSSNPRNYYRCSIEGCNVKKRIERMEEDSSYVITSYEGTHNHHALNQLSYSEMPSPTEQHSPVCMQQLRPSNRTANRTPSSHFEQCDDKRENAKCVSIWSSGEDLRQLQTGDRQMMFDSIGDALTLAERMS